ncbi:amino acid transporter LysE [Pokkaliibacter plantistimulans]|uniref:Amino acid transporter LysE n=2 Tax=Pseudomonadota TaxID=1224 RepID=A0ABX5LY81_9GAMM|nr:leucine efflux protein LeuE [Pokkaliibacter plantistimulans]PPC75798.1 leucine efflux protein LeuE [Pokkaliibacter plantistimulans]PXF31612.1 amino acid transporter LysE [Pokkaliibacter plantistimulans]
MAFMGIHDLWSFIIAVLVFLAIPGPGTFALLTASGKHGVRGGYATLGGLILGDQILMWLAAGGVAALLAANPTLFKGVQYLGAAYLVWIGIQLLRSRGETATGLIRLQPGHLFRQGMLITLLNPKAIVFYMAFFPLFIDPVAHQGMLTFATMAALIALLSLGYCSLLIFAGTAMRTQVQRHRFLSQWLQRLAGLFLVGFGIRLGAG